MSKKRNSITNKNRLLFKDPIYTVIYSGVVNNVSDWKKNKHSHSFSEILFVKKGHGLICINDKKHEVKYGDIVIYNPQDLHQELCYENEEFKVFFVALKQLGDVKNDCIIDRDSSQIVSTGVNSLRYKNYFADIVEEMQNKRNNNTDLPIYLAGIVVSLVKRMFSSNNIINNNLDCQCEYLKQVIDRDFCIIKQIDDLLKDIYVSKYYFYKKFKEMYSLSPLQYLKAKKIKYSEELLKNSDLKISEIASIVGYENDLYFSRIFKQEKGISATEYRNQIRK